jgi:hypothetical protein
MRERGIFAAFVFDPKDSQMKFIRNQSAGEDAGMKKIGLILLLTGVCHVLGTEPAHAYLDPGSGSMFLQLLLGGAAGLGIILKLYWHRVLALFGMEKKDEQEPTERISAQAEGEVKNDSRI